MSKRAPNSRFTGEPMNRIRSAVLCVATLVMMYAIADHVGMGYTSSLLVACAMGFGWPWPEREARDTR